MTATTYNHTHLKQQDMDTKPWYKQFWPWFLISLPMSAVIAGITTIIIAMDEPDGIVVDDYYKQGLAINRTLSSEKMAQQLNLAVSGKIDGDTLQLQLTGNIPAPEKLTVHFIHPTKPNNDKSYELTKEGKAYFAGISPLADASWHVKVEPENGYWRLSGRFNPQQTNLLELKAGKN